jgi:hypothetical protein
MMKSNLNIFLVICLMVLLISPPLGSAEKIKVKVIVNIANVRLKPDLSSAVIGKMPLGTILESEDKIGEWYRVILPPDGSRPSRTGYMHNSVVEKVVEEPVRMVEKKAEKKEEKEKDRTISKRAEEPVKPAKQRSRDLPVTSSKENRLTFGLQGGAGLTMVNLAKASGYDEPILSDWGTFHYKFNVQAFYKFGLIELGLEVGYNDLYWYSLRIPYGIQTIYRENSVSTMNIYGLLQHVTPSAIFLQAGAGIHVFDEGSALGFMGTVGYDFRLSERLSMPIFLRFDLILGDGTPTPVSLGAGIRYRMSGF